MFKLNVPEMDKITEEIKMDKSERLEKIKQKISSEIVFNRSRNAGENKNVQIATEIINKSLKDGISVNPIFFKECGFNVSEKSFPHWRDKITRYFEIAIIQNVLKLETFSGEYGIENTQKIRKHLSRGIGQNIQIGHKKENPMDVCVLIDISDKLQK